jgi:hypothetical protein
MHRNTIVTIITSYRDIEAVREGFPTYEVRPVENVPAEVLNAYKYWTERP